MLLRFDEDDEGNDDDDDGEEEDTSEDRQFRTVFRQSFEIGSEPGV